MPDSATTEPPISLKGFADWFIAIGAFIYTTGFLVALNFTDYIGAREATTDLFRAKYVLMGILCLSFPTIIVGCSVAISVLKTREDERVKSSPKARRLYGSMVILAFNLILTFYAFIMFAPKGYLRERPILVWIIFGVTIIGYRLIEWIAPAIKEHLAERYHSVARWILCAVVVLGLDTYCFWNMRSRLYEILIPRGVLFFLFVASIAYIIVRLRKRASLYPHPHDKMALWLMGIAVCSLLYVLMVYTFSFIIYPQIAANRGGGDYTDASRIVLHYDSSALTSLPEPARHGTTSPEMVLIDESEGLYLIASPDDSGGPSNWRNGRSKPEVYAIAKSAVCGVTYLSRQGNSDKTTGGSPTSKSSVKIGTATVK